MKYSILVAALATCVAFTANAMPAGIDTDGDGVASLTELQVSNPELTPELFQEIDTDEDGFINDEELDIGIENDLLEEPEDVS